MEIHRNNTELPIDLQTRLQNKFGDLTRGERTVSKNYELTQTIISKKARTRTNMKEQICI